jgi:hypothetical protein
VCSVYTFPGNQILSVKVGKIHICHGKEGKLYVFTHTRARTHTYIHTHRKLFILGHGANSKGRHSEHVVEFVMQILMS